MMKSEKYLEVQSVGEIKEATDGRRYQQIWVLAFILLAGKRIFSNAPSRSINVWEQGPPSEKGKDDFSKGDPLFNAVKQGDLVEGDIVTENVEDYNIEGSNATEPLTTYTMVVFPHQNKYTAFENAGHPIVDSDGVVHTRAIAAERSSEKVEELEKDSKPAY